MIKGFYLISPLIILTLVVGVNFAYLYYLGSGLGDKMKVFVYFAGIGLFLCILLTATLDPGYLSKAVDPSLDDYESTANQVRKQRLFCLKCKTTKDDKVVHDHFSDLCVRGHDHFCIVLGNVIGIENIRLFYSIFVFYGLNVIALVVGIVSGTFSDIR